MADYSELIKALRDPCPHENCVLSQQAANAIEYLSTFEFAFRNIVNIGGWWLVGRDKNIYRMNVPVNWPPEGTKTVEIFPLPEPPKEEQT